MDENNTKKGRVIINIERRTLKIILWLNLFLFIGFFILGFFVGSTLKRNKEPKKEIVKQNNEEIKVEQENKEPIRESDKITEEKKISKKEEIKSETEEKKVNEQRVISKKNGETKKEKLPEKIVVETGREKNISKKEKLYTIQVMSLKDKIEAEHIVNSLKNFGCDARIYEVKLQTGIWYRVRIGNFTTKDEAFREGKRLEENGIIKSFWISERE
ncbi:MAG TPA: SPOR domain-containing protein [bacterium]|nr:SPOR domain-containing protein [bacterium]HOL46739.1 SPOR domain-containing protein [bacterium]HPQ18175.1 SPOR domain-containing protein [bacterium]